MIRKAMIIPDSFKGSMTSVEVSEILSNAIKEKYSCETVMLPIADGGEGSTDCILTSMGGIKKTVIVHSPENKLIESAYGILPDGTAVIEIAESSGITRQTSYDAMHATTYGFGELIRAALDEGCRRFLLCLGGSATTDCGCGMAEALGVRFYFADEQLHPCGGNLSQITKIDNQKLDSRIAESKFTVMSDVENPLYGPLGAAYVYAPQKGASEDQVKQLDAGLENISAAIGELTGISCENVKGAGAAGGAGYGCAAFLGAEIVSGIEAMLDITEFDKKVWDCDLILTGEGKVDRQSLMGKVLSGIEKHSKGKKIISFCGISELTDSDLDGRNIEIIEIGRGIPLVESILHGKERLTCAAKGYFD